MNPPSVRPFFVEIAQEDGREKKKPGGCMFQKVLFFKTQKEVFFVA